MRLQYAGATHVGMKRDHNEDSLLLQPEQNLFVVADGMGGHSSGEVASKIAVDTLRTFFEDTSKDDEVTWPFKPDRNLGYDENRVAAGVKLANRNIYEAAQADARYKGMGTTCVGMLWVDECAVIGHVGDSRCYRIRGSEIAQLTEDHSLLNDYKKIQQLTPEEEAAFQYKNIIVRALGMKEAVVVDVDRQEPQEGDVLLLCSDGLSGEVPDDKILELVNKHREDLDAGVQALIQAACDNGGKDNVTVVLVKYLGK
ncbi:MAG: Stp1/IreP family PP2C-type Ser/Thr phosphatase [Deltaproteobacteria bacterium]|nr:Stp1/IreP family PP2C-type Ser/Thr phosphatase [Deltaproteobacteria bacterium]